jgi:hypothetical protein
MLLAPVELDPGKWMLVNTPFLSLNAPVLPEGVV